MYFLWERCISTFNSIEKVKNQHPQSTIMQKWKFSFLLNILKYCKNGETKFSWNCIVSFFNNFRDVKVSSHYHYVLAPQISWYLTLFTTRETFSNFRICSFTKSKTRLFNDEWKKCVSKEYFSVETLLSLNLFACSIMWHLETMTLETWNIFLFETWRLTCLHACRQ